MAQFMLIILLFPPDGIHYQDNTAGSTFYSYENGEQRASNKGRQTGWSGVHPTAR